jgi:Tfp pilus assembly protein PilX
MNQPRVASNPPIARDERGIALIMALMVLLAMSLLAVLLMVSLQIETKIAGHSARYASALNIAEAGVGEALARIRNGDIPNTLNPRTVGQIFLANAGSIPSVGADTIAMGTGQPAGSWLDYSTPNKTNDVLTVRYKTDAAQTVIYRYDQNVNPPINYTTGFPIWVVTARGQKGNDIRRIETEVVARPYNVLVNAAMAAKKGIDFGGNAKVCGYNHRMDTPAYTNGVHGPPNGPCVAWEINNGDLPGSWSEEPITSGGSAEQGGTPLKNSGGHGAGFYTGPWDALGLTQAEFYSWIGPPLSVPPATPNGIYYLDNNTTHQDASGIFAYNGANGEGFLYIDGDMTINGNFTFRGLIYIEGDLKVNGNSWILGALVVKGKSAVKIANGSCVVLYSRDAVQQNITKYGQQFLTLAWREIP